jgi:UDP-N-acetylglucosamine--N-acetylmuramyl-(pentapeptide) pyrophosphoryl-undecaprenol N-acetylglucosamine transferase
LQGKSEQARQFFHLDSTRKTVLIIGGSLGARTINRAVEAAARRWEESGLQVIWQTGKGYIDQAKSVSQQLSHVQAHEFIREMDLAYAAADLVVSRAGAMSISELCLVAKPAIFVPSPNVSEDHQTKNAMALVSRGAALLVKDVDAESSLGDAVLKLVNDHAQLSALAQNAKNMAFDHAAERIVEEVMKLIPAE